MAFGSPVMIAEASSAAAKEGFDEFGTQAPFAEIGFRDQRAGGHRQVEPVVRQHDHSAHRIQAVVEEAGLGFGDDVVPRAQSYERVGSVTGSPHGLAEVAWASDCDNHVRNADFVTVANAVVALIDVAALIDVDVAGDAGRGEIVNRAGAERRADRHPEGFVRLGIHEVAVGLHGHGLRGHAWIERQGAARCLIVGPGDGGAVAGGVGEG